MSDFQHSGVKGMKWGHRKQKSLDSLTRIANGKGKVLETLSFKSSITVIELVKNKGDSQKIAAGRAAGLRAQKDRIESGNATKWDKLDRAMNTSLLDLLRNK